MMMVDYPEAHQAPAKQIIIIEGLDRLSKHFSENIKFVAQGMKDLPNNLINYLTNNKNLIN